MGQMPNHDPPSVPEIMMLVANLPDERVEEVFQGVARLPQISSHVLNRMANVMSDMYADSREAPIPHKRRSTRQSVRCTQPSNPPSSTRRSARINRSVCEEKGVADSEPSEDDEDTESEEGEEPATLPLRDKGKVTLIKAHLGIHCFCRQCEL